MRSKPTLGGLMKAQDFLAGRGFPMPIFQKDIYENAQYTGLRSVAGKGTDASLDDMIDEHGALHEAIDVRLTNEKGDTFIQFSEPSSVSLGSIMSSGVFFAGSKENNVVVEISAANAKFKRFMESEEAADLYDILRWGKAQPTLSDWFKFRFRPQQYATEVFA